MRHALVNFVATVCFLATISVGSISYGQYNELVGSGNGSIDHSEQSLRFGWIPPTERSETNQSSPVRLDEETDFQKSLRWVYDGRLDRRPDSPYEAIAPRTKGASPLTGPDEKKDFTPERIKKQGNENKNYAVMISASWCTPCKKMYPHMAELRKRGYIIYVFDATQTEFENYAALYAVKAYPTFIIYDKGSEVQRSEGITNRTWFKKHLKLKKDQIDEPIDPENPYDGL